MREYFLIAFLVPFLLQAQDSMVIGSKPTVLLITKSKEITELNKELTGIKTPATFINYFTEHAADYSDFDSLYKRMYNKPCPENYSYGILHGQLKTYPAKTEKSFLYLLCRNYQPRITKDKNNPLPSEYMLLREAFQKYMGAPGKDSNYIMPYGIRELHSSCRLKDSLTLLKKDFTAILKPQNFSDCFTFFDGILRSNDVTCKHHQELVWWGIEPKAKSIPVDPHTKEAKELMSYMHAQFFQDIAFVKINGRFVWMDVSR